MAEKRNDDQALDEVGSTGLLGFKLSIKDQDGNAVREGCHISMRCYNGEEYDAGFLVVKDPYGGSEETEGYCLKIVRGNKKAMSDEGLRAFFAVKNGQLIDGRVVQPNDQVNRPERAEDSK